MKIVKVFEGPEHAAARDAVYGSVHRHPAYDRLSKSLKPRAKELIGLPDNSPLYPAAWEMLIMGCLVGSVSRQWEKWLRKAGMPTMAKKIRRWGNCVLPGAILDSPRKKLLLSCKQPSICPFCRYRRMLKLFDFVSKDIERGQDQFCLLGKWGAPFPLPGRKETVKDIENLWRWYKIRRGFWLFDVIPYAKFSAVARVAVFGFPDDPFPSKWPRRRFRKTMEHHRVESRSETILGLYGAIGEVCAYPMSAVLTAKKDEVLKWASFVDKKRIHSYATKEVCKE